MDLQLDSALLQGHKSPAQVAKALTEDWVSREAYCLSCGDESLDHAPTNSKALDFRCCGCNEPYELKASRRPFGNRVLDGEYRTFLHAIASQDNPNLLLLNYNLPKMAVTDFRAVPRYALSRLSVIPRNPLGPNARRAGWQGCNIDLTGLPSSALVSIVDSGVQRAVKVVLRDWRQLDFIRYSRGSGREWLPDVMSCLRRVDKVDFDLEEVYAFSAELRALHPKNQNVEPKIRQQLQILVAQGLLERVKPGLYKKARGFW